ncbi:DUF58 domain-containing protein [Caldisericum exile]|uniref:DUF58 domain-containing protein n=1 Tax=Caldisericum exile TaxID=693075 RepID=UPI0002E2E439|nr:DUF58 domain-containing protein [Caldisericum exile]
MLYAVFINKVSIESFTDVSTYTLTLGSSFDLKYFVSGNSVLPIKISYEVLLPYYLIPISSGNKGKFFGRNISVENTIRCRGNRRGTYNVGEIEFRISDPLALFNRIIKSDNLKTIFVFPNIVPLEKLKILLSDPFEGQKAKYRINFDYSYVAGVREYNPFDPVSMIHWKQTAHRGKLMVKEFDFSASKKIYVALNLHKKSKRFQDNATSIAASVIYYANKFHLPNAIIVNSKPLIVSLPKTGEYHMLENFKLLSISIDESFETLEFIQKISDNVDFGSELFYIDKDMNLDALEEILKIKKNFSKINIILLVDDTFVKPNEKPPSYYFMEPAYVKRIASVEDVLRRESIYFYPIFGNEYLTVLER